MCSLVNIKAGKNMHFIFLEMFNYIHSHILTEQFLPAGAPGMTSSACLTAQIWLELAERGPQIESSALCFSWRCLQALSAYYLDHFCFEDKIDGSLHQDWGFINKIQETGQLSVMLIWLVYNNRPKRGYKNWYKMGASKGIYRLMLSFSIQNQETPRWDESERCESSNVL